MRQQVVSTSRRSAPAIIHTLDAAPHPKAIAAPLDLMVQVDAFRIEGTAKLSDNRRSEMGQFLTPAPVASLLASLLECPFPNVSLLDAGAGVGSLSAAVVSMLCSRAQKPTSIHVTAYEIDPVLASYLKKTLALCRSHCDACGVDFTSELHQGDFLLACATQFDSSLWSPATQGQRFNCVIQNPPYRKINSSSKEREYLRQIGIETTNLYTGFLYAAMRCLAPEGELVAITPRSFCNGSYFRPFRQAFLQEMQLRHLHVFETRKEAFKDDAVLQETLVFRAVKTRQPAETVTVTSSLTAEAKRTAREVPYREVVNPTDPEQFIHVAAEAKDTQVAARIAALPATLSDLGLRASTGRVVDFRATQHLRMDPNASTAPLIWPLHLNGENGAEGGSYVDWPRPSAKKPNAIVICEDTESLLVPNGNYVLVKRFSAKEQRRRVTAAIYEGKRLPDAEKHGVGFENHLNYFHAQGQGLALDLARGLAAYLNSTLVDEYFRLYSGHTQVNATDLKNLRYPSHQQLVSLGKRIGRHFPNQEEVDLLIQEQLFPYEPDE